MEACSESLTLQNVSTLFTSIFADEYYQEAQQHQLLSLAHPSSYFAYWPVEDRKIAGRLLVECRRAFCQFVSLMEMCSRNSGAA